jgi:hypothetical protein
LSFAVVDIRKGCWRLMEPTRAEGRNIVWISDS